MVDKDSEFYFDLHKKQYQLYLFLKHVGTASWQNINRKCNELISSCTSDFKSKYGNYPIYKLFTPLIKTGIIDSIIQNNDKVYVISKNTQLFSKEEINICDFDIRSHFLISEKKDESNFEYRGKQIMNRFPSFKSIISNWNSNYIVNGMYYIRKDGYYLSNLPSHLQYNCIYKEDTRPYTPMFFFDEISNKGFQIPANDEDYLNLVRLYIRLNKNLSETIVYNSETKELYFNAYNEIPVVIYRALIMQDIKQLSNLAIYTDNRNDIPFTNISPSIYKNILRIFEIDYK